MKTTIFFALFSFLVLVSCEKTIPKMAVTTQPVDQCEQPQEEKPVPLKKHDRW